MACGWSVLRSAGTRRLFVGAYLLWDRVGSASPDGSFSGFEVVPAPVMAPELAARYPQIRTYAGRGLDDPSATARFDLTQRGFHAMILSSRHPTVFIEPWDGAECPYLCFYGRDLARVAGIGLQCETIDEDGMRLVIEDLAAQGFGQGGSGEELRTYRTAIAATGEYTRFHGGTVADGLAAPSVTPTGNARPTVDAGAGGLVLPIDTPFRLEGSAVDPDGDPLTCCWEEFDLGPQGPPDSPSGNAPIFRSFNLRLRSLRNAAFFYRSSPIPRGDPSRFSSCSRRKRTWTSRSSALRDEP